MSAFHTTPRTGLAARN